MNIYTSKTEYLEAENKRLHAENERKDTIIKSWLRANAVGGWIDDLRALNDELLEVLKDYHKLTASDGWYADKVSAAIAKAEGEQE